MKGILVREIMSRNPIGLEGDKSVMDGAMLMKNKGISAILVNSGNTQGIVTERDMVTKIVSTGLDPKEVKIEKIMSYPLVTVNEETPVEVAAEIMWKNKIRRLPVKKDESITGILTENDIVRISPGLIEITREIYGNKEPELIKGIHGVCDVCKEYSENLIYKAGKYYCELCFSRQEHSNNILQSVNQGPDE
ncbi:MAG: CBS domain-containing protein [Candidatus Thermoplasmatota archaeon]|nr:CBS domain-containing protein [Candidatus Thermoplasmatota archaeon]